MGLAVARKTSRLPRDCVDARNVVVAAAETCFARFGVARTTMEDIAQVMNVSRTKLYRVFPDRQSVIMAVVAAHARSFGMRASRYIARQATVDRKIVDGLLYVVDQGRIDPYVRLLIDPGSGGLSGP